MWACAYCSPLVWLQHAIIPLCAYKSIWLRASTKRPANSAAFDCASLIVLRACPTSKSSASRIRTVRRNCVCIRLTLLCIYECIYYAYIFVGAVVMAVGGGGSRLPPDTSADRGRPFARAQSHDHLAQRQWLWSGPCVYQVCAPFGHAGRLKCMHWQ